MTSAKTVKQVRILHLIKSLGRGGAEMLLPETLKLHNKEEFKFYCIYFLPWKNQMVQSIEEQGVQVQCMNASNNLKIIACVPRVMRYCRENNIDIIHCHLPWAGFVGRIIARRYNISVIYTEHNKQERYNKITKALNKLTFNWQRSAVAVSNDVKESILKNIKPSIPVHTVLNGVNTGNFLRNTNAGLALRREHGINEDAIVIGTLAVFRFQKRLDVWLEVVKELHKLNPLIKAVIVGDGPLKEELIEKRKALGLEDVVIMPGLQTNTIAWFSMMDVFMMSSIFEGLPIALLEAMSCECSIVATDAGGTKEVVRNNIDGLLCSADQPLQLVSLCMQIISNNELRNQLALAARLRVIDKFSMQQMVSSLENIYDKTFQSHTHQ